MPRRARARHAGVPQHVIQRGNNRAACFFADADYRLYLDSLMEGAMRYGCDIFLQQVPEGFVRHGPALSSYNLGLGGSRSGLSFGLGGEGCRLVDSRPAYLGKPAGATLVY